MRRWDSLVDGYQVWCEQRGLCRATIVKNRRELDRWGCWMKSRRPKPNLEEVDGEWLVKYVRSRTPFHSKALVSGVMSILRGMGEHLVREGIWQKNPMRWLRGPRLDPRGRLPKRIGKTHLSSLWEAAAKKKAGYERQLSVAVLALLYGTGLRRGELERLNVEDWKREEGVIRIDGRKTGRERSAPVMEGLARCLEAYLPLRQNRLEQTGFREEKALLLNRSGRRLSCHSLSNLVHGLAKRAGVPLVSLHQFRHTCAADLLEEGVSLPHVQELLGHESVSTTSRYLHISDPQRVKAVSKHPLNDYLYNPQPKENQAA
jgi:integrase/recombinase XerC